MKCDNCGKLLGENDDVADVQIDLTKNEVFDLIWCRECTEEMT